MLTAANISTILKALKELLLLIDDTILTYISNLTVRTSNDWSYVKSIRIQKGTYTKDENDFYKDPVSYRRYINTCYLTNATLGLLVHAETTMHFRYDGEEHTSLAYPIYLSVMLDCGFYQHTLSTNGELFKDKSITLFFKFPVWLDALVIIVRMKKGVTPRNVDLTYKWQAGNSISDMVDVTTPVAHTMVPYVHLNDKSIFKSQFF